ncbi:MAG: trypsin-like peptidase domain-containing protein [Usitatibacter sp.]
MIRSFLCWAAVAASLFASANAAAEPDFRAPRLLAAQVVALEPLDEAKILAPRVDASGRLRVATVRALPKAARIEAWTPMAGGFVARILATSQGAAGLRVKLELGTVPGAMEVRTQGATGKVETMVIDPAFGNEAWTPWTDGETQIVEVFSLVAPSEGAVNVAGVLHFTESVFAKAAAASCTISTACSSGDAVMDAAIDERKRSVFKIQFVDGGLGYVCTATLIDTPRRPAAYALTANHCIDANASAASITSFWFYEASSCSSNLQSAGMVQVSGGAQLAFTNFNIDTTLLLMNSAPPTGALYSPVNAALVADGQSIVSISHPHGDTSRWALGASSGVRRDGDRPYDMYYVNFSRGIVEPGSSGSGLFTMNAGRLELRGVLSQAAVDLSCSSPGLFTLYTRMEAFYPEIAQYIGAASVAADDAPNRPQDLFNAPVPVADAVALNQRGPIALDNRRIDYAGDVDIYRFSLSAAAYVSAWTEGTLDTVGAILDSNGVALEANDDADWSVGTNYNFGITRRLDPGTYYVHVANWVPTGTGPYSLRIRADLVDVNYTDLWGTASESGWGLNINHQGNTLFGTLFTYDTDGTPMWLVMSSGDKQSDGSYSGALYRGTGNPFSAAGWSTVGLTSVGTMRLAFASHDAGTLTYTVNGASVTKSITRYAFSTAPTCTWSAFDRAAATNYQDLWWNPGESGWGVNISHQGSTLFATLFVYDANRRATWYVMSQGLRNISGAYSGTLYRTAGPAFNASPWTTATVTPVGNMSFTFSGGNAATLTYTVNGVSVTKQIQRDVFGMPRTQCES